MDYMQGSFPIVKKENIARGIYSLWIHCPPVAEAALPGQFAHLKVEGFSLRRPISICEIDPQKGNLRLVFEIRGEGTRALADSREGGMADLIAPLGNGFSILPQKQVVLVGGGIGVPPLLEVAKRYGASATAILGFRSASAVILERDFQRAGASAILCTDDGTAGIHGFVTKPLEELLTRQQPDLICACGPTGMLKGVVSLAGRFGIDCEVSMEERMGCGVGACLVCACKCVKDGREFYAHVCKDGPVFPAKEVVL